MENPWTGDLDKYLFYCCPECDEKSANKYIFIEHALESHPSAKNALCDKNETELPKPKLQGKAIYIKDQIRIGRTT